MVIGCGREVGILIPAYRRRMPAKASNTASITIRPRCGVDSDVVGTLRLWLDAQLNDNVIWAVAVTEPNKGDNGRHLHVGVGFKNPVKCSDDYKDRLKTLYRDYFRNHPDDWTKHTIKCVAHDDPGGLVGGYYVKDDGKLIEFQIGKPPSDDEQAQGAARRDRALERLKKLKATKRDIPHIMKIMNDHLLEVDEIYDSIPNSEKEDNEHIYYGKCDAIRQVDMCYKEMINQGYYHLMSEMTTGKLKHYVQYWKELISAPYV